MEDRENGLRRAMAKVMPFQKSREELSQETRDRLLGTTGLSTTAQSLRAAWKLIKPYWTSEDKWKGYALLGSVIGLTLGQVYLSVQFNEWNGSFFNALQGKDYDSYKNLMMQFGGLASVAMGVAVYKEYLNQALQMRWRTWMTDKLTDSWLASKAFHHIQNDKNATDNPDQRIADDVGQFTSRTLGLSIGLLKSSLSLPTFMYILWNLSGDVKIGGTNIPGFMMWAALGYAVVGTYVTHKIGKKLSQLNFDQQRYEADFRYGLVRVRENTESIALADGEPMEKGVLSKRFDRVVGNWWRIMRKNKQLNWLTSAYSQAAVVFPFLIIAPRYFANEIELGDLTKTAGAFNHVQGDLSWFVDAYPALMDYKAVTDRLGSFTRQIEAHANPSASGKGNRIVREETRAPGSYRVVDLSLKPRDQESNIIDRASFGIDRGDRLVLSGPSGSGKTTVLRALTGLWNHGTGYVNAPEKKDTLFVPQKPYLPLLPLKGIVCYPHAADDFTDEEVRACLEDAELGRFTADLHDESKDGAFWSRQLSGGEQQKLMFARMFLQKPTVLMLDEVTSAMDPESEKRLYGKLLERLPHSTVVSVAHREAVRDYHTTSARIEGGVMTFDQVKTKRSGPA